MITILLVEDNELNRDMLSRRLAKNGFRVIMAEDGKAGVDVATRERPDLILMDLSLPVMDGWEATRLLKNSAETSSIPIIALTAHAMAGDEEQAYRSGCDDFDTKPVDFNRLLGKMQVTLRKSRPNE